MRDLKLPALYRGHPLFTTEEDFEEAREIRRMSGRIISATSAIEQIIAEIIVDTIFREVKEHRDLVFGSVLNSDWCSLSAKRKLLVIIIEKFALLTGPRKNQLEKNLKKVTQYRNAFAHGTLAHNIDAQELHYFEGTPQTAKLDQAYFDKLEEVFLATWELLEEVKQSANRIT
jgi:hypothetical protein